MHDLRMERMGEALSPQVGAEGLNALEPIVVSWSGELSGGGGPESAGGWDDVEGFYVTRLSAYVKNGLGKCCEQLTESKIEMLNNSHVWTFKKTSLV